MTKYLSYIQTFYILVLFYIKRQLYGKKILGFNLTKTTVVPKFMYKKLAYNTKVSVVPKDKKTRVAIVLYFLGRHKNITAVSTIFILLTHIELAKSINYRML